MSMSAHDQELFERLLEQVAEGDDLPLSVELSAYFDSHPEAALTTLDRLALELRAVDARNEEGIEGLANMLSMQLEHLRYRLDRGYQSARDAQNLFERRVVELVQEHRLPGSDLGLVIASMTEAGLEPGAELEALEDQEAAAEIGDMPDPAQVAGLMDRLVELAEGDVFAIADSLLKGARSVPAQARALLAGEMLRHPVDAVREAAALLALDRDADVRRACSLAFLANVGGISPAALRRLIVTRHWLPEAERHLIDQVVREARAQGIEIETAPSVGRLDIRCSGIDGAGTQGFIILAPVRDAYRMVSVLVRYRSGILDAWCGETGTKRELVAGLESAHEQAGLSMLRPMKRDYLDRIVGHHVAIGLERGTPPPAGLLQVAESVGAMEWRPRQIDWRELVEMLLGEVPASMREPKRVAEIMASVDWANPDDLLDGWFEDDPEAADVVRRMPANAGPREALDGVIGDLLEPRRQKWAAHFAWIALWLHERTPNRDPSWVRFALLARELDRGQLMGAIALMNIIAFNTIEAMEERLEGGD
jgi:hypothetical protein